MTKASARESMYQKVFMLFICILACGYYYSFFMNRAQVNLEIQVSQNSLFKIYWADDKQQFSEKKSVAQRVNPSQSTYTFSFINMGAFTTLRFDPIQYSGEAVIKTIKIFQKGYKPINVNLSEIQPLNQIISTTSSPEGLQFSSTGNDPFFLYLTHVEKEPFHWGRDLLIMALICITLITFISGCSSLLIDFSYVPIMMSMVLVLITAMAVISKRNSHPDEYVHLAAASYYQDNWLPPDIEDEDIEDTYSVYGMSRLNNGEIYYLLAGKAANFFQALNIGKLLSLRLFNVLLFSLIVIYTVYSAPARAVALPFLISPQIWYIFSYCTSDAFALFICFIAGCELVRPGSILNKALDSDSIVKRILPTLSVALLIGLLLLLKKNYYPFIAFFYICLLWRIFKSDSPGSRSTAIIRIIVLTVLAIGFAGIRIGMDYYVNGPDRQEKIMAMQEKTAHKWYKPSTELQNKHVHLYQKERGVPLKTLVFKANWFEKSFQTAVGMYGYFTIIAPDRYYEIAKWFALILLVYTYSNIFIRGSIEDSILAVFVGMLSVALIGVSLYHSWTMDFQAQGRYLFPILSMFGLLLGRCRMFFDTRLFVLSISQLYLLGLYSFIFIALVNIPRP